MTVQREGSPGRYLQQVPAGSFVHVAHVPGSPPAARSALAHAVHRGSLVRVRRGLYFKGPVTRYGMVTPTAYEVALEVLGWVGVGPAGVCAVRALGLTTQVPARCALAVVGRPPRGLPGVRLHGRSNVSRVQLTGTEIAVLEALRVWRSTVDGGWAALRERVRELVAAGDVRADVLRVAAAAERRRGVAEQLEDLLSGPC